MQEIPVGDEQVKKGVVYMSLLGSLCFFPANTPAACLEGNCRDGYGIMSYPDGSLYDGQFKNGKRDGYGTLRDAGGSTYKGHFSHGKKHGKGTFAPDDEESSYNEDEREL